MSDGGVCWRMRGRQRKFQQDMQLLNSVLDELILNVVSEKEETDLDALIAKDYDKVNDPSLLRSPSAPPRLAFSVWGKRVEGLRALAEALERICRR